MTLRAGDNVKTGMRQPVQGLLIAQVFPDGRGGLQGIISRPFGKVTRFCDDYQSHLQEITQVKFCLRV